MTQDQDQTKIETGEASDVLAVPMNAPLDELIRAQEQLAAKITHLQRAARADDLAKARELVRRHQFTAAELRCQQGAPFAIGEPQEPAESTRRPVPIKYRNAETGDTWTGRGIQPKWLQQALAEGKSLSDFLVPVDSAEAEA